MEITSLNQSAKEVLKYCLKMVWGEEVDIEDIERRIEKTKTYVLRHQPMKGLTYWDGNWDSR